MLHCETAKTLTAVSRLSLRSAIHVKSRPMKLIRCLSLGSLYPRSVSIDLGLLLIRLATGILLCTVFEKFLPRDGRWGPQDWFINDVAKMGFPAPVFFAWCAVLAEFVGGILLALGLLSRRLPSQMPLRHLLRPSSFTRAMYRQRIARHRVLCFDNGAYFNGPGPDQHRLPDRPFLAQIGDDGRNRL